MRTKRVSITIDGALAAELSIIKKEKFYDKSFAEMYRYLVAEGAKQVLKKGKK